MQFSSFGKVCALALACVWVTAAQADPKPAAHWQEYKSAEGGFRVEMPAKPMEDVKNLPSAPNHKMYAMNVNFGAGGMLAVASDLAADRAADPEKLLDFARDTALKSMNAAAVNEKKEMLGRFPARRLDYAMSSGFGGTMRLVISGNRLYQVNVIGPAGYAATPEARRFLDSFALTSR
jgi:hypothetical protein